MRRLAALIIGVATAQPDIDAACRRLSSDRYVVMLSAFEQMNKNIGVVAEAASWAKKLGRTFVEPLYCRSRVAPPFAAVAETGLALAVRVRAAHDLRGVDWTCRGQEKVPLSAARDVRQACRTVPMIWDTSRVTDMDYLLGACWSDSRCVVSWSFNEDVSNWDTSNVKSMVNMFRDTAFNQAIGVWDVSQVTDMSSMFEGADSFNQPLNGWDVSKVKSMYEMLEDCTAFNQPLDRWDTSSLTDMSYMFKYATKFNQPLNTWDVSTVTSTQRMFEYAYKFNQPLDNWRLDKAKEIKYMFQGASKFKQDLGWCLDDDVNQNDAFLRTKCEKTSCGVEGPPCQAPAEIVPAPTYRPTYKPSLRGSDDDDCADDEDWSYTTKEGDVFTCERVAEKLKRCTIRFSADGVRADEACKKTCGTCP